MRREHRLLPLRGDGPRAVSDCGRGRGARAGRQDARRSAEAAIAPRVARPRRTAMRAPRRRRQMPRLRIATVRLPDVLLRARSRAGRRARGLRPSARGHRRGRARHRFAVRAVRSCRSRAAAALARRAGVGSTAFPRLTAGACRDLHAAVPTGLRRGARGSRPSHPPTWAFGPVAIGPGSPIIPPC